ncbi:SDR family oxidoreductase [Microbacterium sp. CFH 31415]|uniref:SDR family NAD(P)-dependent oxidoreductase n=1 Tax=Microbacterium sp. CFH 31415 TaxID=2921732 RepID=UPI001F1403EC|nr:SDR family NAD(P)-dependent oxidoreductase [Microbacterium sp. CFH 31415]MCH6231617.1 SDR family oxidoreductase [Microbacterium sp. CFH 31415]
MAATSGDVRISVVTGGALGIGGATSRRLAADGDHVVLLDIDGDAAHRTADAIRTAGGTATVVVGDATVDADLDRLAEAASAIDDGRVDVLVNNVGDFRPAKAIFLRSSADQWEAMHRINLRHVFATTFRFAPAMIARGQGVIVNVSTVEAFRGIPGHAVYSAYKAGVAAFTKSMAVELGPSGVRVVGVAPDLTDTEQTPRAAMLRDRDPELIRSWLPIGRFGLPEDAADVIAFLASGDARFVTGTTIPVDGGTLAASGWYGRTSARGWTNMPDGT